VWPVPTAGLYAIHLLFKADLPKFATLTQDINLPPEYEEAILYNLTVRLAASYQVPLDPVVVAIAKSALNTVRNSNAQVPLLRMPRALTGQGNYNVYTDGY
jgi:hypothetical protein